MFTRHRLVATAFTTLALIGMVLLGGCGKNIEGGLDGSEGDTPEEQLAYGP